MAGPNPRLVSRWLADGPTGERPARHRWLLGAYIVPWLLTWAAPGFGQVGSADVGASTVTSGASAPSGSYGGVAPAMGGGGGQPANARSLQYGVRSSLYLTHSDAAGSRDSAVFELSPYVSANLAEARNSLSLSYTLRNFYAVAGGDQAAYNRHDLRATQQSLLIGDWFGVQSSAAIYNTAASVVGGLSIDPAIARNNAAVYRTLSIAPYIQGRWGSLATYRAQYRLDHASTSSNVTAGLSSRSHLLTLALNGGPQFNPWGWGINSSASRREFGNGVDLSSASTSASLYYTPNAELRLGASLNYLYLERLANRDGQSNGWGPGVSLDWSPSRRTTVRAALNRYYYGNSESISIAHREQRWMVGFDYVRNILQSNNAALLTFNPGAVFSGGGFSPQLNPLFNQLSSAGLLNNSDVVLGTNVINDALVRNRSLTFSFGYVGPRWNATLTAYRSVRETLLSSEVFGIADALAPASFGRFGYRGVTLSTSMTIDPRNSVGMSISTRTSDSLSNTAGASTSSTRFSFLQANWTANIDTRTHATLGYRLSRQSADSTGAGARTDNTLYGTLDFRLH